MGKRIVLFVLTNLLIIVTLNIVMSVFGVRHYITAQGMDYNALLVFCLIWGFGAAFISLALSRVMAKWMMGVKVIDPAAASGESRWLVDTVHGLAKKAGLTVMPEVGIYDSPEVNAFATGPSKKRSLVAVSAGLLSRMNKDQVEGVLSHEMAHVANGDMVTMTLVQGVVNAFVMFIARAIAFAVSQNVREESRMMVNFAVTLVLEILLSILGMMVVAWFSRLREFRADAGGAQLGGRDKMVGALQGLRSTLALAEEAPNSAVSTLKISSKPSGMRALFATHPPLEERIARLQAMQG